MPGGAAGVRALPSGSGATADVGTIALILGIPFVLNQFFQGTVFPPCAKLIAHWVPPKELATKMSVWNGSHSIGGGLVARICGIIMAMGVIGFISLFSYVGASLSGKLCGSLVQTTGSWFQSVAVIAATVGVGAVVFMSLWRTKSDNYV